MAINFPDSPSNGDTQTINGSVYTYNSTTGKWDIDGDNTTNVTVSDTAPSGAVAGDQWFNSTDGSLYVYYNDGSSSQWVGISGPAGSSGEAGEAGGVTSYADKTAIDAVSSPSEGDLAFDEDKNVLYIRAGSAWERIQHGGNVGPRFTTTPASTLILSSGSTSTITADATDENGFPVTYDWDGISGSTVYTASSLPNQITNVSESNGVFTLTPSTNSSHAGSFTFRTKASDGAQVSTATTNVSLLFTTDITTPNTSPFNSAGTNSFDVSFSAVANTSGAGFSSTLSTGKYYFEIVIGSAAPQAAIGLCDDAATSIGYNSADTVNIYAFNGRKFPGNQTFGNSEPYSTTGDIMMWAYDTSTREVWVGINGNWYESPSASSSLTVGTSSTTAFKLMFSSSAAASYNGTIITGSGTLNYSVPTGFTAH